MKVCGFTFIKNAITYDYPIVEAIRSILPICDEIYVVVGKSDDGTLGLIEAINSNKIKIIKSIWDESQREGGRVLAMETDKGINSVPGDADWLFYIQGDEVVHEKYLPEIKQKMNKYLNDERVDGLLFKYKHFYGSYDYIGSSEKWYKHEIRVVRNIDSIYSYKDAQGFRKNDNEKLNVAPIDAYIYHYGWVKDPRAMQLKQESFQKLWHDDNWVAKNVLGNELFDYEESMSSLEIFKETHPAVMEQRIKRKNWKFEKDISFQKAPLKDRLKSLLRKYLGLDFSYKNYRKVKF